MAIPTDSKINQTNTSMKKHLLFVLLAVVAMAVGCQNDKPQGDQGDGQQFVQVDRDTLFLGSEASTANVLYVNSHDDYWSYDYDSSQEWCMVYDGTDEFGDRCLIVDVTENTTDLTREISIVVTNGNAADEFVVSQSASEYSPATKISIADTLCTLSKDLATVAVEVESDGDYEIVIPEESFWIIHDNTEKGEGKRIESFFVSGNFAEIMRTAQIAFVSPNAEASITVRQWGTNDLNVDTEEKVLLFLAGRDSIHVETISEYTATVAEGDWVRINEELSSPEWVVFDYDENLDESESRSAVITIATATTSASVALTQIPCTMTEMPEGDKWIDDIPANITSGEASTQLTSSRKPERAFDGNTMSAWYSTQKNTEPQQFIINVDASNVDRIDYLRYVPATATSASSAWGNWKETEIYVTDADGNETLLTTYDFRASTNKVDVVFEPALPNTITRVRFVIKEAKPYVQNGVEYPYVASAAEIGLFMYNPEGFAALKYFTDWSLSELRDDVTYDMISQIKDPFYRSIAEQIFCGTYDDEFRVCEFKAYPCPELDANILRDKTHGVLSNVTGMYVAEAGVPQYIYLDEDYGLDIYVRIIDYKNHSTATHPVAISPHDHLECDIKLQKGRNVITPTNKGLMYILAFTEDDSYAQIPPMKAHFVNSGVNGYLDYNKHTVDDVLRIFMLAPSTKEPRFDLVGDHFVINYEKAQYLQHTFRGNPCTNAQAAIDLMEIYDSVTKIQERMMGHVKYKAKGLQRGHRNRMTFLGSYGSTYAYSAWWHTGYSPAITPGMLSPMNLWARHLKPEALNDGITSRIWGLAHELGHSNQTALFTWRGMTEVSNNMMCLMAQNFMYGVGKGYTTMRWSQSFNTAMRDFGSRWVTEFDKDGNWYERPFTHCESVNSPCFGSTEGAVDPCTQLFPFYQLFLYFHLVEGNSDFLPDFYELCRTKDIYPKNYANEDAYQSAIILEFMKTISEASGQDMSDWANAWGLPGVNYGLGKGTRVNHYGQTYFTTTQEQIDEAMKHNSQFPKPKMNPFYIHDLNLELYRNPQPVVAGTHTVDDKGNFAMSGWQNVVAWVLVDPDKLGEDGKPGRDVAVLMCNKQDGGGTFNYAYRESRYIPKAENDFSNYLYNNGGTGANRLMADVPVDYAYTKSLQLYAVDAYGTRYASQSNTK